MSERLDPEKAKAMTALLKEADHNIEFLESEFIQAEDIAEITFDSGKKVQFPLFLNRELNELRRSDEISFYSETLRRVIGRALYEGFTKAEYLYDEGHGNIERLLGGVAFKHPDGRVITAESCKSYAFSHSYRYDRSRYFESEQEYAQAVATQKGEEESIISRLVKDFSDPQIRTVALPDLLVAFNQWS